VVAEELEHDAEFALVDELYRRVGLRDAVRYGSHIEPIRKSRLARVIAYRVRWVQISVISKIVATCCCTPRFQKRKSPKRLPPLLTACSKAYSDFELEERFR